MNEPIFLMAMSGLVLVAQVSCTSEETSSTAGAGGAASSNQSSTNSSSQSSTTAAVATVSVTGGGVVYVPHCNPVTNAGCEPGYACDSSIKSTFMCYEPPNDGALCGACDVNEGPWCTGGLTCTDDKECVKFCCDDGDCGTGTCSKVDSEGGVRFGGVDVGFCVKDTGKAACDAPAVAPSMGKCITVTP